MRRLCGRVMCLCRYVVLIVQVSLCVCCILICCFFFFQAEDGIRDLVRSRGLGDVYKRQDRRGASAVPADVGADVVVGARRQCTARREPGAHPVSYTHLTLPTSDLV